MDDVKIQLNEEKKGVFAYHSLPIYRLFCEQLGLTTEWDQEKKTLQLTSSYYGKKIYLLPSEQNDTLSSILEASKTFLIQTGMKPSILPPKSSIPTDGELSLQLDINSKPTTSQTRFSIFYSGQTGKTWARFFQQECKKHGFSARINELNKKYSIPTLELRCQCTTIDDTLQEKISFIIATSLLRGLSKDNLLSLLPLVSLESMKSFFTLDQTVSTLPTIKKKEQQPLPTTEKTKPIEHSNTTVANPNPFAPVPFRLDACFDYQLVFPSSEEDDYLIIGNLHMKNTGLAALINPHIHLKVTPAGKIPLKGQIVPPKMTDTVGVQGFSGDSPVGWKYVEEDWFKKSKEHGEYQISPIQLIPIAPGETITFPNFQLSIPNNSSGTVQIEGTVHFIDQKLQFPATNQIVLSFP